MKGKRWLFPVVLLLLFLAPGPARAADVRFQSSTQYLWYNDPFLDKNQSDVVEYLKIGATAIDNAGRFSAFGYGRVSKQLGAGQDGVFSDSDDILGRLYYLYVNYALPGSRGDIRLGRQFVVVGAGAGTIDGVRVDARNLGPVALSAFAGYDVRFRETTDLSRAGDFLLGASAGASFLKDGTVLHNTNIELSYLRKYNDTDIVREMLGVHADQGFYKKAKAYVDWRYDILHEASSELLAGVKLIPFTSLLTITGEYFQSYPNFDADSIFTVFAVTRYKEVLGRVDYIVTPQVTLFGSYTRADYEGPTADIGSLGARFRPKQVEGLGIRAAVDVRRGYPGDLTGLDLSADYTFKKANLAAGVAYDVFQRDSMTDDFSAKKYWAGGSYEVRKNMTARLRVEDKVTRQSENEFSGRVALDVRF
ncbi:MAG: hypothetical protein A2Z40_01370 [Deltaproteobacteria bacterium RBG_19FT_COMBO_60_16]|nr:MAG: hypothetical protein A2Z13_03285 [Deltaproteobacteria bacterium RBG_16_64_85]OGQ00618.1 MAG: hypothetical protein A2Z40_01370 [Deltaproteobacteria bacterium RBG_19FT_COMBO_60_16]